MPKGRRRLLLISGSSLVAGLAQAAILYLLVQASVAVAVGGDSLADKSSLLGSVRIDVPAAVTLALLLAVVMLVAELVAARAAAWMSAGAQTQARNEILGDFLRASWDIQSRERQGHLQELLTTHVERVGNGASLLATGAVSFCNFVTLMAASVIVNPQGTFVILIGAGTLFVLLRPLAKRTRTQARQQAKANAGYAVRIAEAVRLAQEIRVFDAGTSVERLTREAAQDAEHSLARTRFLVRALPNVYQAAALSLVLLALAGIYFADLDQVGGLGTVVLLLVRGLSYSQSLQAVHQQSAEIVTYVSELSSWQKKYQGHAMCHGDRPLDRVRRVAFQAMTFSYSPGVPVLQGLNFAVEPGESIGIVGPSGSGKSTLVQILLRLRDPDEGAFLLNEAPASSYRQADFYRNVAFVPQQPQLLRGTVMENIRFFRGEIDDEAIVRSARLAHVHDDILEWTNGYEREIGDGAADLSGGQRQRLIIARALAGNPTLLILDEPTSALDVRSDELFQRSLSELKGRLTMFIVAHRLSTLDVCDRIMVVERGKITALAAPAQLAGQSQFFSDARRLARLP